MPDLVAILSRLCDVCGQQAAKEREAAGRGEGQRHRLLLRVAVVERAVRRVNDIHLHPTLPRTARVNVALGI